METLSQLDRAGTSAHRGVARSHSFEAKPLDTGLEAKAAGAARPGFAYSPRQTVVELFEAQALRRPDALALSASDARMTYSELNAESNRRARRLREAGVGRGDIVGLYLDRSAGFVISVLAVLKAGAAYLPLPIGDPPERLLFLVQEAKAKAVVALHGFPAAPRGVPLIEFQDRKLHISSFSGENLNLQAKASDPAYVMFTSGSTGRPKGIVAPHRAIARLVSSPFLPWSSDLRFLLLAPVAFDASTLELWGPLLHGGLCVVHPERHSTFHGLEKAIRAEKISCLWLTAGLFNQIVDFCPEILRPVKFLLTGGEALSVAHVRRALSILPDTQIINGYGPTEAVTFTTTYSIPRELAQIQVSSVPIGRPLHHTTCHVLDERLNPVSDGTAGELYIGGDGLALGYLNRPELTSERFVSDLFSPAEDARLYRSGDLCRRLPDGNLEYLGRLDQQVKLRRFRIELDEIKETLREFPGILDAAVIVCRASSEARVLVAYVATPEPVSDSWTEQVLDRLRERLPAYSVPAAIVRIDRLPLTRNGKLDQQALPPWQSPRAETSPNGPALTGRQATVAGAFAEILGTKPASADDNFFSLGGNSLLAARLVAVLREKTGAEINLGSVLAHPTLAGITQLLDQAENSRATFVETHEIRPIVFWFGPAPWTPRAWPGDLDLQELPLPDITSVDHGRMALQAKICADAISRKETYSAAVFGGYCYDGVVALEAAALCREMGISPAGLVIADTLPAPPTVRWVGKASRIYARWRNLPRGETEMAALPWFLWADRIGGWRELGWRGIWRRCSDRLVGLNPFESRRPVRRSELRSPTADFTYVERKHLASRYWSWAEHPVRAFTVPLTLLLSSEMAARKTAADGTAWREFASAVEVKTIGGTHYSCIRGDANNLGERVARAARRHIEAALNRK